MDDRGIRVGMTVRDASGTTLGRVRRVYAWGFEASRRFWSPYQWVFRHDEVTGIEDGVVAVSRGPDDLQRLAAGELPETWLRYTPPMGGPSILAAPAEAQMMEGPPATGAAPAGQEVGEFADLDREDEAEYVARRGEPDAGAHAHG